MQERGGLRGDANNEEGFSNSLNVNQGLECYFMKAVHHWIQNILTEPNGNKGHYYHWDSGQIESAHS
jgi:hypothetical protein